MAVSFNLLKLLHLPSCFFIVFLFLRILYVANMEKLSCERFRCMLNCSLFEGTVALLHIYDRDRRMSNS